jgi:transcriptional regulator with XRE-family HTH domain
MVELTKEYVAVYFGKKVRTRRKGKRWTQAKLSGLAGLSKGALQNYESGKQLVRLDKALDIAKALGVPIGELLP